MKKGLLLFCLLLAGCKSEKEVLCDTPIRTDGNLRVVNQQCMYFGDRVVGFLEMEDRDTKKHYVYTMNAIDGKVVLNLTSAQAIAIAKADDAEMSSAMAVGMAAGMAAGRR